MNLVIGIPGTIKRRPPLSGRRVIPRSVDRPAASPRIPPDLFVSRFTRNRRLSRLITPLCPVSQGTENILGEKA